MNRKIVLIIIVVIWFSMLPLCFAEGQIEIIGDDIAKTDLRNFDGEWLIDEFEDTSWSGDLSDDLNDIYEGLYDNWDNRKANDLLYDNTGETYYNPQCLKKYSKSDYIDIIQVYVDNLDKPNARFIISVTGDAKHASRPWFLFVWSDCGGDESDNLIIIGIFIPEGFLGDVGGDFDATGYYEWGYEGDSGNGTIDFDDHGSDIMMPFDSDIWDEVDDCNIRVMMMTTSDDDYTILSETDMIIDIFPGTEEVSIFNCIWFWIILIIIIILIVSIIILYIYLRKRRNKKILPFKKIK